MTRLIDANKLWQKVFFHTYPVRILDNENKVLNEVLKIIDNAPTVEYDFYDEAYQTGYEEGKNERQKGEWIKDIQGDTICKNCGFECLYNEEGMYSLGRYCHHCGADMREAENEQ